MKKPTIFSFFSGAGFLDLGFENTDFNVAFVNELHEPFMRTYKHSRTKLHLPDPKYGYHSLDVTELLSGPKEKLLSDAVNISKHNKEIIGFIGGPPCPDFSIGGKNKGSEGENGKLTATYVELICKQKPDFFVLENVKGLWRTKKHRIFYDEMKTQLINKGYLIVDKLINAIEFGVPQKRQRIILIGFRENSLGKLGLFFQNNEELIAQFPWTRFAKYSEEEISKMIWSGRSKFVEDGDLEKPEGITEELTVQSWFKRNQVKTHPNAHRHFKPRQAISKFQNIDEGDNQKKSFKRLHRWSYSPTAAYGNNEVHLHPYKARRISVSEALAIQSLPKEFELPNDMTLTDSFKTVGNGVPYLLAEGIAKTIASFIGFEAKNYHEHAWQGKNQHAYTKV